MTKSLKGSRSPEAAATSEMVVLSPPGIIKASHRDSCRGVRTCMKSNELAIRPSFRKFPMKSAAFRSRARCSIKAPCNARTPTVVFIDCLKTCKGYLIVLEPRVEPTHDGANASRGARSRRCSQLFLPPPGVSLHSRPPLTVIQPYVFVLPDMAWSRPYSPVYSRLSDLVLQHQPRILRSRYRLIP